MQAKELEDITQEQNQLVYMRAHTSRPEKKHKRSREQSMSLSTGSTEDGRANHLTQTGFPHLDLLFSDVALAGQLYSHILHVIHRDLLLCP